MKYKNLLFLPLMLLALLGNGCAPKITTTELLPVKIDAYDSTERTILILPVTERSRPKPGFLMNEPLRIDKATFRTAIVETVRQTNLFSEVNMSGDADYTLTTDILGQRLLGVTSSIELLLVRYVIRDNKSKKEVWSGNLFSHFELAAKDVFAGSDRTAKVIEGATRDNMTQLSKSLGIVYKSPNKFR